MLVDAPFTMADAHRVVAMILDSRLNLTHVFVTHDHPDHFFAMEVIQEAFPDAQIVAHPTVVADIWRSLPFKVARWSPTLGANGPVHPSAPAAMSGDTIMLEGRELRILGPVQGDHPNATVMWVPESHTLIAGDLVFNGMHLWFGEHTRDQIQGWHDALGELAELEPQTVVAGHARPGLGNDPDGIAFSKRYIERWLEFSARAKNSAELRAMITAEFPDAEDVLGDFLLGNSSKVTMGEEPLWVE